MKIPFLGLFVVLGTTAIESLVSWDGFIGVRLVVAGAALFVANARCSREDLSHLFQSIWPALVPIVTAIVLVVLQIIPLPVLTNPVWDSARAALGTPLSGHISVDLPQSGAVLLSLSADTVTFLLAAFLAIDRFRAVWTLLLILGVTTFENCFQLYVFLTRPGAEGPAPPASLVGAASGVIIALSGGFVIAEKARKRGFTISIIAGLATFSVVLLASSAAIIVRSGDAAVMGATCYGVAILVVTYAVRRTGHVWAIGSALVISLSTCAVIVSGFDSGRLHEGILAFVAAPESIVEQTNRMIDDTPLLGTGAGTFLIVHGLYRGITDMPLREVPSAASAWAVELGRMILYSLFVMGLLSHILLLWGGLHRGRDFAYPLMGSGLISIFLICMFVNDGPTDAGLGVLLSAALGMAFSQRLGRG